MIPAENIKLTDLVTNVPKCTSVSLKEAMASCHSLTLINGVISGDPLDVKVSDAVLRLNGYKMCRYFVL